MVRIELLLQRGLGAGLVSLGLVSAIMMATLVVGPFYLSDALGLGPVQTVLVMSIGPGVAAFVGLPAGRLAFGSSKIMVFGLGGVIASTALVTVLPSLFGVPGYVAGLALTTAGYALFQAANNTGVMAGATKDKRGLTSAQLGLSRKIWV